MTNDIPEPEQQAVRAFGGVAHAPRVVNIKTRPDEVIHPAPCKDDRWQFSYLQREELTPTEASAWVRSGTPTDSFAPVVASRQYLERRQWATSIWIPESEAFDPEQNTLTLRGYYRVYLFDVWVKPGEHVGDEETTQP